jgi:hypothetical protein
MYRMTRWGGNSVMGDSIIATMDTYDQRIYAIGKGPTQTTVSTNPSVLPLTDGIMIQGSVTDISPGTQTSELKMRFPNGVPAVSDADQSIWMQYLYQNKPQPTNVKGVPVHITAVDSTGKVIDVGHATSDIGGLYSIMWTPPSSGLYTVVAAFEGSGSYYPSQGETAIGVAAAVAPIVTPTPTTPSQTASPIVTPTVAPTPTPTTPAGPGGIPASTMYAIAAAVVVIVIVAVAAVALRRRK